MTAGSIENDAAQWNNEHIACVGSGMADNADDDDHRRQQPICGYIEQSSQRGVDKAGVFGNADSQHRNQDNTDRMKVREVGDHDREKLGDRRARQQVHDDQGFAGAGIDDVERHVGQQPRQDPDEEQQRYEQHCRVGKLVTYAFYRAEKAAGRAPATSHRCGLHSVP